MNAFIKNLKILCFIIAGTSSFLKADVSIEFIDIENYRDIESGIITTDNEREVIMDAITKTFQKTAKKYLPEGYNLSVSINDIDLAGDVELAAMRGRDYRILTDIYPPRIKFHYEIRDNSDAIVLDSDAYLKDLAYMTSIPFIMRDEPAIFVSQLVKNWGRRTLRSLEG
ncbi:DUF3016 domain-containing protein [Puniceicoccaceae bacterium K14]|nr:DUF3016 domain-containing protein [Puniceicoccaceae bacterium K14]